MKCSEVVNSGVISEIPKMNNLSLSDVLYRKVVFVY